MASTKEQKKFMREQELFNQVYQRGMSLVVGEATEMTSTNYGGHVGVCPTDRGQFIAFPLSLFCRFLLRQITGSQTTGATWLHVWP